MSTANQSRGVSLVQVHPPDGAISETDIDIIAIHGLDTKSPDTWIWKNPKDPKNKANWVNWLKDPEMLPARAHRVRIFTCDWPAELFEQASSAQMKPIELGRLLLDGIIRRPSPQTIHSRGAGRPILFIASCLGGIILVNALLAAHRSPHEYGALKQATRGIVFLATPFRGTSFEDVARWAEHFLKVRASLRRREVSCLIESVKGSLDLEELVRHFTQLCQDKDNSCHVFNFYELKNTSLWSKALPCLPASLRKGKQLVDRSSATLDVVPNPLPLDRCHLLMNKFESPECRDYDKVSGKIEEMLGKIREGTLLSQADAWICDKHYTAERLKIERLSGELLPMDQCYVNLAIVEQGGRGTDSPEEGGARPSPFSLWDRLKVETPDKTIQVELPTIFSQRKGRDGREIQPRRILIRGRAGVGKTTLCKRIIHKFTQLEDSWSEWGKLFDRVLWVPLRNLKLQERRQIPGYNFELLFCHEFFSLPTGRPELAKELSSALEADSSKTLFLLDGLDEVSQDLSAGSDAMSRFFNELLNQPNVIITSRPSGTIPAGMLSLDLELETIGFYPDQVEAYLNADPKMKPRATEVQSFLQERWLLQGLVRIPIQLDALCLAWDDFRPGTAPNSVTDTDQQTVPNTMTGIYQAIVRSLWKKDVVRLERRSDGQAKSALPAEIENDLKTEIQLLECLAFNGMYSDIIDFTPEHLNELVEMFPGLSLPLNETLSRLSFLRTSSDSSSNLKNRAYHFIHLTFQEYFASRYLVRQWNARKPLEYMFLKSRGRMDVDPAADPVEFFRKHKYAARYDVMWRFVTGLFAADDNAGLFIDMIEAEPRDLLGPTHQRLVMRCLSEVDSSARLPIRLSLEENLLQWVLFECEFRQDSLLVCEPECPEEVIVNALVHGSESSKLPLLRGLQDSSKLLSEKFAEAIVALLEDKNIDVHKAAVYALRNQPSLPGSVVEALLGLLKDQDQSVREAAAHALRNQPSLPGAVVEALLGLLKDQDQFVQAAAASALRDQPSLSGAAVEALLGLLKDQHQFVRAAAAHALRNQPSLSGAAVEALLGLLKDQDQSVQAAAAHALGDQPSLPGAVVQALLGLLKDQDQSVRAAAVHALGEQPSLPGAVVEALLGLLKDQDQSVRAAAAYALRDQPSLPGEAVEALVGLLKDQDQFVRAAAAHALRNQPSLPGAAVEALLALLKDQDQFVREAAASALENQQSLSKAAVEALLGLLKDQDQLVRESTTRPLRGKWSLLGNILKVTGLLLASESQIMPACPPFDMQSIECLYELLLDFSFEEHLSLYIDGHSCILDDGSGLRTGSIEDKDRFDLVLSNSRHALLVPGFEL